MTIRTATLNDIDIDAAASLFDAYRQFYQHAPNLALATAFIFARMQASESVILLALNVKK
jgi:hypothetical protein